MCHVYLDADVMLRGMCYILFHTDVMSQYIHSLKGICYIFFSTYVVNLWYNQYIRKEAFVIFCFIHKLYFSTFVRRLMLNLVSYLKLRYIHQEAYETNEYNANFTKNVMFMCTLPMLILDTCDLFKF
jgi:hypothetical protein